MLIALNTLNKETIDGEKINRIRTTRINPDDVLFVAPATKSDMKDGWLIAPSPGFGNPEGPICSPPPSLSYKNDTITFTSFVGGEDLFVVQTTKKRYLVTQQPETQSNAVSLPPQDVIKAAGVELFASPIREELTTGYKAGHINLAHTAAENVHPHLHNPLANKSTVPFDTGAKLIVDKPTTELRSLISAAKAAKRHQIA